MIMSDLNSAWSDTYILQIIIQEKLEKVTNYMKAKILAI